MDAYLIIVAAFLLGVLAVDIAEAVYRHRRKRRGPWWPK